MASKKVVKMKKASSTAKVLFAILVLYVLIFGIITFSKKAEKTYEVKSGNLAVDNSYTGFVIRSEEIVNSTYAGNVNYYVKQDSRVKAGDTIYTVDETGRVAALLEEINKGDNSLAEDDVADIRHTLNTYKFAYDSNNFDRLYDLKLELDSTVLRATNQALIDKLDTLIEQTGSSNLFQMVPADKTGIVQYTIDGYEGVTLDSFTKDMMATDDYKSQNLYMQDIVVKDNPVYRLITDETWYLVFELSTEEIDKYQLNGKTTVNVNFKKDKISAVADFSIMTKDDTKYGVLKLRDYMIRFADDRYVEFELYTASAEGLKIPVSALTEENFYVIPVEYLTNGGTNGAEQGFMCEYYNESGGKVTEFIEVPIFYNDGKLCYVSEKNLSAGYVIQPTDKIKESLVVAHNAPLTCVFCVNTGYTVFKRVEILEQGKEYCIVKKGIMNGLSVYDRILLDAEGKVSGEMIY